jgi:CHASE2 domain-containing sensor protein
VSLTDLPKDLEKSIVIVGITAAGLGNPVPTSVGSMWPHEMQAAVLSTMIDGVVIERPVYADLLEVSSFFILTLLLLFLSSAISFSIYSLLEIALIVPELIANDVSIADCLMAFYSLSGLFLLNLKAF